MCAASFLQKYMKYVLNNTLINNLSKYANTNSDRLNAARNIINIITSIQVIRGYININSFNNRLLMTD